MKGNKFFRRITGYDPSKPTRLKALMMFTFFSVIFLTLFFLIRILVNDGNIVSAFWNAVFIFVLYVYYVYLRYTKKIDLYILIYAIVATAAIDMSLIVEDWPNTHQLSIYGIVLTGIMILATKKLVKPLIILMMSNFIALMVISIYKIDFSLGTKEYSTELYFILIYVYAIIALNFLIRYFLTLIQNRFKAYYKENLILVKENKTLNENNSILLDISSSMSQGTPDIKDLTFKNNSNTCDGSHSDLVLNSMLQSIDKLKSGQSSDNEKNEIIERLELLIYYLYKDYSFYSQKVDVKNVLIDEEKLIKASNIYNNFELFTSAIKNILNESDYTFDFKIDERLKGKKYIFDLHIIIRVIFGFVSSALESFNSGKFLVEFKMSSHNKGEDVLFVKASFNSLDYKQDILESFSSVSRVNNLFKDKFENYHSTLDSSKFESNLSVEYPSVDFVTKFPIKVSSNQELIYSKITDYKFSKRVILYEHNLFSKQQLVNKLSNEFKVKLEVFNSFEKMKEFLNINKLSDLYLIVSIPFTGKSKRNYYDDLKLIKEECENCNISVILDDYSKKDLSFLNNIGIDNIFIRPIDDDELINFLVK
jgi:hypothetical protein